MVRTLTLALLFTAFATAGLLNTSIADGPTTFTIDNQQAYAIGTVTITTVSSFQFYKNVTLQTTYTQSIPEDDASITINGQTVNSGQTALVTLPGGDQVGVKWSSTNYVIIVDKDEI